MKPGKPSFDTEDIFLATRKGKIENARARNLIMFCSSTNIPCTASDFYKEDGCSGGALEKLTRHFGGHIVIFYRDVYEGTSEVKAIKNMDALNIPVFKVLGYAHSAAELVLVYKNTGPVPRCLDAFSKRLDLEIKYKKLLREDERYDIDRKCYKGGRRSSV